MDASELYHFLFETYTGIGVLVGTGVVACIIYSFLMEIRTRRIFKSHDKKDLGFNFFDEDDEQEEPDDKES